MNFLLLRNKKRNERLLIADCFLLAVTINRTCVHNMILPEKRGNVKGPKCRPNCGIMRQRVYIRTKTMEEERITMEIIQFQATVKSGVIEIPAKYREMVKNRVRVILVPERKKSRKSNLIDQLLKKPLRIEGFHPLSRNDLYER
jgi:hypothetical protein